MTQIDYIHEVLLVIFFFFSLLLNSVFTVLPLRQVHRDMVKYNVLYEPGIYFITCLKGESTRPAGAI